MFFWNQFPFVRIVLTFSIGIILTDHVPEFIISLTPLLLGIVILVLLSLHVLYRVRHQSIRFLTGLFTLLCILLLASYLTSFRFYDLPSNHISHPSYTKGFRGIVDGKAVSAKGYWRYLFRITHSLADSLTEKRGHIYLYAKKDSLAPTATFQYGDILLVNGSIFSVKNTENPYQFDYATYLKRRSIYGQSYVKHSAIRKLRNQPPNPVIAFSISISQVIDAHINLTIDNKREKGILRAMLIGSKDLIDSDLKEAYAAAGAMHILAVSGLHVGIIYMVVRFLFSGYKSASSKKYVAIICIVTIWLYAFVTGLSPSVLRASIMFSLICLKDLTNRSTNIYNNLAIAALILLLINPYFIYDVGFQLSFLAVSGIVFFHPKIYCLLTFRYYLLRKAWDITCISIAAQLATFPIIIYYFKQFPSYSLLANLIVMPAASIILIGGLVVIVASLVYFPAGALLGWFLETILSFFNEIMLLFNRLPLNHFNWTAIDSLDVWFIYAISITLLCAKYFGSFKTFILSIALFMVAMTKAPLALYTQYKHQETTIYTSRDKIAIDYSSGFSTQLVMDHTTNHYLLNAIDQKRAALNMKSYDESLSLGWSTVGNSGTIRIAIVGTQKFLILEQALVAIEIHKVIETDVLIIQNEAVKNFDWLHKNFAFKKILLAENKFSYTKWFVKEAEKLGVEVQVLKDYNLL